MESPLSSSPTRGLSSWWRAFNNKRDGEETGSGGLQRSAGGKRPGLSRAPASASYVFARDPSIVEEDEATVVYNQGNRVTIPREYVDSPIFGVPLEASVKYASVKISLTDSKGDSFVYGHVPVIIAKCSVYLKQKALDVEGIFRVPGSSRRIKQLQVEFNSPPRFGKDMGWEGYTVHDAANLLRRYLNTLPEPIIPLASVNEFRDLLEKFPSIPAYLNAQIQIMNPGTESSASQDVPPPSSEVVSQAVKEYQSLISALPPIRLQLLVYLLDLLSVFDAQSKETRMPASNLAATFQPAILSHPEHDMNPDEYQLSRLVVEFLIRNSGTILRDVQKQAIKEHEIVKEMKANEKSQPIQIPTIVESPASDPAPELTAQPSPVHRSTLLNSGKHKRQHSKSLSSAASPYVALRRPSPPSESSHRKSSIGNTRKQNSPSLSASPVDENQQQPTPTTSTSAESVEGTAAIPMPRPRGRKSSTDDETGSSIKSKWRRSILGLFPDADSRGISPSRGMSPPSSWFSRRGNSRGGTPDE